jgi:hypothetical protein
MSIANHKCLELLLRAYDQTYVHGCDSFMLRNGEGKAFKRLKAHGLTTQVITEEGCGIVEKMLVQFEILTRPKST